MEFTKKAINAVLPSVTYIRQRFLRSGQSGIVPPHSRLIKHFIVYDNGGKVASWLSGYGDAMPANLYHGDYIGMDAVATIELWMQGEMTRREVVNAIYDAIQAPAEQ